MQPNGDSSLGGDRGGIDVIEALREKSPEFRPERTSSEGDKRISLREPFSFAQSNVT